MADRSSGPPGRGMAGIVVALRQYQNVTYGTGMGDTSLLCARMTTHTSIPPPSHYAKDASFSISPRRDREERREKGGRKGERDEKKSL